MDTNKTDKKILVIGATGNAGGAVAASLVANGVSVTGLARDESKAATLREAGMEAVIGDMEKPETLEAALRGIDRIFLVTPVAPNAVQLASNVIGAAKDAGGIEIVRLSALRATLDSPSFIVSHHAETERDLKDSGLPFTILRTNTWMQLVMMAAPTIASDSAIYMPLGARRLGMIDLRDLAEAAAAVLNSDDHLGKTYTLTGPASISFADIAAEMSNLLGRKISYVDVANEAAREGLIGMGFDDWTADVYCGAFEEFSNGLADFVTSDVETLIGKPPRSFSEFASDFAEVFGGNPVTA